MGRCLICKKKKDLISVRHINSRNIKICVDCKAVLGRQGLINDETTKNMIVCPTCGKNISPRAKSCPNCGEPF